MEPGISNINSERNSQNAILPDSRISIITGGFGAGKTEVSVNYAIHLARIGLDPSIVDLDIVNPYFRSREAREQMIGEGVNVILPPEELLQADIPIITPRIRGLLSSGDGVGILDVGGDDLGARVLASFGDVLKEGDYTLLLVVNTKRPFFDDVDGVLKVAEEIKDASGLKPGGLIANTHLMEETSPQIILEGLRTALEAGDRLEIPVIFVAVMSEYIDAVKDGVGSIPILEMERIMLPPWKPFQSGRGPKLGKNNFRI